MDNSHNEFNDNRPDDAASRAEKASGGRPDGHGGDRNRNNRSRFHQNHQNRRPDRQNAEGADGQAPEQSARRNDRQGDKQNSQPGEKQANQQGDRAPRPRKPRPNRPDRSDRAGQKPHEAKPAEGEAAAAPAAPRTHESHIVWSSSGKGKRPNRPVAPQPVKTVKPVEPASDAPVPAQAGVRPDAAPADESVTVPAQERSAAPNSGKQRGNEQRRQQSRPDRQAAQKNAAPAADAPAAKPDAPAARIPGQRPPRMPHKAAKPADLPQMNNLLIEDTPEEYVNPDAYAPSADEIDRILQRDTSIPRTPGIPEVVPEGKVVIVGIRFRASGKTYFFDPGELRCQIGQHAIVDTARGLEYGEICLPNRMVDESLVVPPLRPLVRIATPEDVEHNRENHEKEAEAYRVCIQKIRVHKLDMKLVTAQYTFDNTKLLFYFTSPGRVDFRELVRDLASVFHIRIELRQIGIRDEARMIGGLGACGRPLCCSTFLSDFGQVSMKMAKEQNLSLNSSKISGVCGRLMCCLRYEYETYQEEIRRTPSVGTFVMTPDGPGVVTEIYPLPGEVKVSLSGQNDNVPKRYKRSDVTVQTGSRPGRAEAPAPAAAENASETEQDAAVLSAAPAPEAEEEDASLPPRLDPDTPSEVVEDEPDTDE